LAAIGPKHHNTTSDHVWRTSKTLMTNDVQGARDNLKSPILYAILWQHAASWLTPGIGTPPLPCLIQYPLLRSPIVIHTHTYACGAASHSTHSSSPCTGSMCPAMHFSPHQPSASRQCKASEALRTPSKPSRSWLPKFHQIIHFPPGIGQLPAAAMGQTLVKRHLPAALR
jgi:hypothetical protein